jgi:hypothetical protein
MPDQKLHPITERHMNRRAAILSSLALCLVSTSKAFAGTEVPVTPEVSPPGDIPDTQVFITYKSPAGFSFQVPEGWARKDAGDTTSFQGKYDVVAVTLDQISQPLDMKFARQALDTVMQKSRAGTAGKAFLVRLPGGDALKISYTENSEPNAVTGKQIRMESERFYFAKNDKLVSLYLSAPLGSDNVDQWKLMSSSFRWN